MLHFYYKSSKICQGMKYTFICTLDAKSIKFNVWHQQLVSKTILQLEDLIVVMVWLDSLIKRWRGGQTQSRKVKVKVELKKSFLTYILF